MRDIILGIALLVAAVASAAGQDAPLQAPKSPPLKKRATGTPCVLDFERGKVPDCVHASRTGMHFITPRYLAELSYDSYGLAAVHSQGEGWMYVNRKGKVLIVGIPVFDNWADSFNDGLVRFVRNKKYGFANRRGLVVIPPVYDGAMQFDNGRAEVCKGCVVKCSEPECEHHFFAGGAWFSINTRGEAVPFNTPEYAR